LAIEAYEQQLAEYLIEGLQRIKAVTLWGPPADHPRTSTVSFTYDGHTAAEVAQYLGAKGVFVRDGDFYAPSMIDRLGCEIKAGW
jgi:selenocysteine lyase/cysteine desulfurase